MEKHTTTEGDTTMTDPRIDPRVVGPRVVGGRYRSGYWRTEYTVTAIEYKDDWRATSITCLWADGTGTSRHSTAWCDDDKVVAE
tara:strand:- start:913 stop:1164 length:252 start_codon:yes stop_codon:yes gene_type:complete